MRRLEGWSLRGIARPHPSRPGWGRRVLACSALLLGTLAAGGANAQTVADTTLDARARAIHERVLVLDAHVDIPLFHGVGHWDPAGDGDSQVDLPKLERGGVDAAVFSVAVLSGPRTPEAIAEGRRQAETLLRTIHGIAGRNPGRAELALTPEDIVRIHREGKLAVLIGLLNVYPFGSDLSAIDEYYEGGVRMLGFTHGANNDFADSSRPGELPEITNGGLSPLGREAVEKLNRLGVIIDVSQLSKEAVLQVAALSRAPIVASHSNPAGFVEHPRNLSDEELDAIGRTGGVVHITPYNVYLVRPQDDFHERARPVRIKYGLSSDFEDPYEGAASLPSETLANFVHEVDDQLPRASVQEVVDAVEYVADRIGIDQVGFGSDFNQSAQVIGWTDSSETFNVTRELVLRGYSEEEIAKIWSGNFLRVFAQVEAVAAGLRAR